MIGKHFQPFSDHAVENALWGLKIGAKQEKLPSAIRL